jgi:hypothetical protein
MGGVVMRNNRTLIKVTENMKILYQYLYMDESHTVVVNNRMTDLELSMNEHGDILCRNMKYPQFEPTKYNDRINLEDIDAIVSQLKMQPATKEYFKNRWAEIKDTTLANIALNMSKYGV